MILKTIDGPQAIHEEHDTRMANPDFNPWIFALLCDSDFQSRKDTGTWSHRDGRPFSKEEQALADSAPRTEVVQLSTQHTRYMKYVHEICDAPDVTQRFLAADARPSKSTGTSPRIGSRSPEIELHVHQEIPVRTLDRMLIVAAWMRSPPRVPL
ncbi:hypothetical protein ACGFR6_30945 [Streptomyces sp. NPDC048567]|uniref:hypothetical protein n=1 Tax=unclassified Streptomyces TaxID=2593676 RepID=UPI0034498811